MVSSAIDAQPQLLTYHDECIETIVDGGVVDAIYLDFTKAFETVPHRRLLGKLDSYGTRGLGEGGGEYTELDYCISQ